MNKYKFAEPQKMLSELLAVIHRDGGQYEWEHGTARAVEDAEKIVQNLRFGPLFDARSTAHIDRSGAQPVRGQTKSFVHFDAPAIGINCPCVIAPVVDPRDEFEAARAINARHLEEMKSYRYRDAYHSHLKHLNACWEGWKLAKGLP